MSEGIKVRSSSGNVFADIGMANSSELLIKAELVRQISELIMADNQKTQVRRLGYIYS
jgi:predicted XRE-type DNA-binding protein